MIKHILFYCNYNFVANKSIHVAFYFIVVIIASRILSRKKLNKRHVVKTFTICCAAPTID